MSHPDWVLFPRGPGMPPGDLYAHMAIAQPAVGLDQSFSNSLTDMPSENLGVSGAFYVPVYSSVSMSQGKMRADFSVTLSIHNASEVPAACLAPDRIFRYWPANW